MFDIDMALSQLPRAPLLVAPTPVHSLERLHDTFENADSVPRLYIKRDDLTGIAMGGNKVRKLEWLMGDALVKGVDTLLTAGAAQSNHCRQTAAVGAMFGLETFLCLRGLEPRRFTGNLVLDEWFGAHLYFADPGDDVSDRMYWIAGQLRVAGRKPYCIPIGGSDAVGAVGYVAAMVELVKQGIIPDYIAVATGSGGTQAGLEAGIRLLELPTKVIGYGVAKPDGESWQEDIANLANQALERLGASHITVKPEEINCDMEHMGPQYGVPTIECYDAIRLLACTEGIFLDPVYSGKAFAGLLDDIEAGVFPPDKSVLFWHTGGTPALFADLKAS